jgi:hypothetical protein
MFTVLGFPGFLPRFFQDFECADFHIQADGIRPMPGRREAVANEVCGENEFIGQQRTPQLFQGFGIPS